ncbi:MAG: enoyl-CoA hydratase-related protein [Legionellaceae bacterium]|nr:enoyl-CoA hydratase-related protein [Legionellaceae bacterium]
MSNVLTELNEHILTITLNRIEKHNAFDDVTLHELQSAFNNAQNNPDARVIVLKSNGKNFSAGADLAWMKRMANFSEEENQQDALTLAKVIHTLYNIGKPTIAMIQGATYGGGLGLIAACDIAIATQSAKFCFSEVRLGLIPAVISPYIVKAIGEKAAVRLFMTAEVFDAKSAHNLQLVQYLVAENDLLSYTLDFAKKLTKLPVEAIVDAKKLVRTVVDMPIDEHSQQLTANLIAKKRVSQEAQNALQDFLTKGTK